MRPPRSRPAPSHGRPPAKAVRAVVVTTLALAAACLATLSATPVDGIVYARGFRLDVGFTTSWGAGQPPVTEGTILVLEVVPELVRPRQVAEPVLYVGDRVAQRVHSGWPSGRMIVLVPGRVDLESVPLFFGTPDLPERIGRDAAAAELENARREGLLPLPASAISAARSRGGTALRAYDAAELDLELAELYERFVAAAPGDGAGGP